MASISSWLLVVLALGAAWGWAVLCWTVRDLHRKTAEALEQAQALNQELARHLWVLEATSRPDRAASAAQLEAAAKFEPAPVRASPPNDLYGIESTM